MMKKKTSGRRKIEMKKIVRMDRLQVTFSKRRTGLFNKASELCVLTGAQIAILVQSPGSRLFAFGHPNVDSVIDFYLGGNVSNFSTSENSNPTCLHDEYKEKYLEIAKEMELEKKNIANVEESGDQFWWDKSTENLEVEELDDFIKSMEQLKDNVIKRADELMKENTSSSFDTNPNVNDFDGLLDDQVVFLPNNGGVANEEDLMMQAFDYDCSFVNTSDDYNFTSGELVLDNNYGNDIQVPSDLWC